MVKYRIKSYIHLVMISHFAQLKIPITQFPIALNHCVGISAFLQCRPLSSIC
jgi:hypothetical protein